MAKDFLDELIHERTRSNPRFPEMVDDALARRQIARLLVQKRESAGTSQTLVAARMRTAPSVISKLEQGGDVRLSTLQKYASALGFELDIRVKPPSKTTRPPRPSRGR